MKTLTLIPTIQVSEATRQLVRKYARMKRVEKRLSDKISEAREKILTVARNIEGDKACNLVYDEEKLVKIILVETERIDGAKLKENFIEVYNRVKYSTSSLQVRLS